MPGNNLGTNRGQLTNIDVILRTRLNPGGTICLGKILAFSRLHLSTPAGETKT